MVFGGIIVVAARLRGLWLVEREVLRRGGIIEDVVDGNIVLSRYVPSLSADQRVEGRETELSRRATRIRIQVRRGEWSSSLNSFNKLLHGQGQSGSPQNFCDVAQESGFYA